MLTIRMSTAKETVYGVRKAIGGISPESSFNQNRKRTAQLIKKARKGGGTREHVKRVMGNKKDLHSYINMNRPTFQQAHKAGKKI